MGQVSNARRGLRAQFSVAVTLSLVASSAAISAEPVSVDGLLQFPNVRVVSAPQAATVATVASPGGMRAYKDSAGSELRGPTSEEMAAASAPAAPKSAARRSASSEAATGADFALPSGGVGVALDESSMQYTVVVRQDDGSLKEICVTGPAAADAVVGKEAAARSVAKKEVKNVR